MDGRTGGLDWWSMDGSYLWVLVGRMAPLVCRYATPMHRSMHVPTKPITKSLCVRVTFAHWIPFAAHLFLSHLHFFDAKNFTAVRSSSARVHMGGASWPEHRGSHCSVLCLLQRHFVRQSRVMNHLPCLSASLGVLQAVSQKGGC